MNVLNRKLLMLHRSGDRIAAWERFDQALAQEEELGDPDSRTTTLGVAGMASVGLPQILKAKQASATASGSTRASRVKRTC